MPKKSAIVRVEVIVAPSMQSADRKSQRRMSATGENWFFLHRRNTAGRFSRRGHFFYYEVTGKKTEEYVIRFSYDSTHGNVKIEVHATGPGHASRSQIEKAGRAALDKPQPKGWKVRVFEWKTGRHIHKDVSRGDAKFVRSMLYIANDVEIGNRSY